MLAKKLSLVICIFNSMFSVNISVLGIGKLGLCTALCLEKSGFNVIGLDVNQAYVNSINKKIFRSPEPYVNEYLDMAENFMATIDFDAALEFSDYYFIVVPTPNNVKAGYDHSILSSLLMSINNKKVKNKNIIICCTVFPGYIKNIARFLLCDCENITISYNPEFIAQGNIIKGFECPDMVLIGEHNSEVGDFLESLYRKICKGAPKICRMSIESAEITKLAINCFVTCKIAYANFIGEIADLTDGADKYAVLKAVGCDSRIGNKYLNPGYGFGGPCFPRDNRALGCYASKIGLSPLLPNTTDNLNELHSKFMADKLIKENKKEYIFEDVNYKESCPVVILEESQKLVVAEKLALHGKKVVIKDNPTVVGEVKKIYGPLFKYEQV